MQGGEAVAYLQDDVIEADEVLGPGSSLVLVRLGLLELSLQGVGHALIALHHRPQLDVGQVAGADKGKGTNKQNKTKINKRWQQVSLRGGHTLHQHTQGAMASHTCGGTAG